MSCNNNSNRLLSINDRCCTATTGCDFDGDLRQVKAEPIYVQKVYDAALFNLQGLKTVANQPFTPRLSPETRIIDILDIRCRKFFNPENVDDEENLTVDPTTTISGAEFVTEKCGDPVLVVGPDGTLSEKLLYTNTKDCDDEGRGTPIFGTQNISITGNVIVEIDALVSDDCEKECVVTLSANVPIACDKYPMVLTNFFDLCMPSVFDTAFLPRFTEFCNIACETRLATNSIKRDINIDRGNVTANLIISLCITCEKKIIVPVQLCVLSTGFPVLSPDVTNICSTFPQLFPDQIDEEPDSDCDCRCSSSEE